MKSETSIVSIWIFVNARTVHFVVGHTSLCFYMSLLFCFVCFKSYQLDCPWNCTLLLCNVYCVISSSFMQGPMFGEGKMIQINIFTMLKVPESRFPMAYNLQPGRSCCWASWRDIFFRNSLVQTMNPHMHAHTHTRCYVVLYFLSCALVCVRLAFWLALVNFWSCSLLSSVVLHMFKTLELSIVLLLSHFYLIAISSRVKPNFEWILRLFRVHQYFTAC